jgi:hypothetical protein
MRFSRTNAASLQYPPEHLEAMSKRQTIHRIRKQSIFKIERKWIFQSFSMDSRSPSAAMALIVAGGVQSICDGHFAIARLPSLHSHQMKAQDDYISRE